MHVDHHTIPPYPTHSRRHNNQRISIDKVANTPLILRAVTRLRYQVELQGIGC